jgi:osmoprotectant transport system permease protein
LLLAPRRAHDDKLVAKLTPLLGTIDIVAMREANAQASDGNTSLDEVAQRLGKRVGLK